MSTLLWPRDHRTFWHSHHHLLPGMRPYNISNFICDVPYCYCHLHAKREYSRLFMQRPPLQPRYSNCSSRSSKKFPFYITNSKTEDSSVLQDYADLRHTWMILLSPKSSIKILNPHQMPHKSSNPHVQKISTHPKRWDSDILIWTNLSFYLDLLGKKNIFSDFFNFSSIFH